MSQMVLVGHFGSRSLSVSKRNLHACAFLTRRNLLSFVPSPAMSADPTPEQYAQFSKLTDIAGWLHFSGSPTDVKTPMGSFLELVGLQGTSLPRELALIKATTLSEALSTWRIAGGE